MAVPAPVLRAGDRPDRRGPSEGDRDRHPVHRADRPGRRQRADPVGHERGHVVLSATEVARTAGTDVLRRSTCRPGSATRAARNQLTDSDGVIRRVANSIEGLTTFGIADRRDRRGEAVPPPAAGSQWIDFAGAPAAACRRTRSPTSTSASVPAERVQGQGGRDRPVGAVAPGRPPDLGRRVALDAGRRDPGERHRDGAARLPAPERRRSGSTSLLIVVLGMLPAVASLRFGALDDRR